MTGPRSRWVALCLLCACSNRAETAGPKSESYPVPELVAGGELVAQIGPVRITTKELEKRIQAQSPFLRVQLKDMEQRKKFVENEVRMEVLAQEAWRRGLKDDPRIQAELKRLIVQRLMQDELEHAGKALDISDSEIATAYQTRHEEFNKPETIRLSQIVRYAESPADKKKARALLETVKAQVIAAQKKNDQNAFAEAAKTSSEDDMSKNGGGDIQFLSKEKLAERYGEQVAGFMFDKVEVGDLAIAESENAVILFKKTGKRRGITRSLETVAPQLRGQLLGDKRGHSFEAWVDRLKKEQNVEVRYDQIPNLEVRLDVPTGAPPTPDKPLPDDE